MWKPGQSGNPKGRPPRPRPIAAAIRAIERRAPDQPELGPTNARALATLLWAKALEGDLAAIRLILEYTIGKAPVLQAAAEAGPRRLKTYISISPDDWPDAQP